MKTYSKKPGNEKLNYISCPVCNSLSDKHFLLYNFTDYSFKKCAICGLVFQNPQPVFADVSQRYDKEYFDYEIKNEEAFFSLMIMALADIGFDKLNFPVFNNKKSILDIGCATGRFLYEFKKKGWDTAGIEICREAANYGNSNRGVNIYNCQLEEAVFPENSFSVVHASHLIEHLNDPVSFLKEIYRIVANNGFLILVTPNIDSFQSFIFKSGWRSAIADHLFLYSITTLKKLCENNGFKLVKKGTWGGISKGRISAPLKKIFDFAAKKSGTGDVMVMLFTKK
jgi:2-polyprenyl-3-methyl-5-hydroxy-6-metoxy-1,4-benzoquinol methylase